MGRRRLGPEPRQKVLLGGRVEARRRWIAVRNGRAVHRRDGVPEETDGARDLRPEVRVPGEEGARRRRSFEKEARAIRLVQLVAKRDVREPYAQREPRRRRRVGSAPEQRRLRASKPEGDPVFVVAVDLDGREGPVPAPIEAQPRASNQEPVLIQRSPVRVELVLGDLALLILALHVPADEKASRPGARPRARVERRRRQTRRIVAHDGVRRLQRRPGLERVETRTERCESPAAARPPCRESLQATPEARRQLPRRPPAPSRAPEGEKTVGVRPAESAPPMPGPQGPGRQTPPPALPCRHPAPDGGERADPRRRQRSIPSSRRGRESPRPGRAAT